ncbi:MAG: peptide/nickel transport system substrate-binding protein [Solirubrobacteraceae bacterium]
MLRDPDTRAAAVRERLCSGGVIANRDAVRFGRRSLTASAGIGLMLVALATGGCGGGTTSAATSSQAGSDGTPAAGGPKRPLTIGLTSGGASLNPAKDGAGMSQVVRALTNAPIIHIAPDGTFKAGGPALATSFRYVGQGNKTFEFKLRSDARFSDGTPVTAAAVKKWLTYFPTENGPYAGQFDFSSIDAKDDATVVLHFAKPNPIAPWLLSEVLNWGAVSSPKAVANPKSLEKTPVGAGPYVFVPSQSVSNDHWTLIPNKYYWDQKAIRFSKITVRIIVNPSSMLQALKTGQLDAAQGDVTTAASAKSAATVLFKPSGWNGLAFMDLAGKKVKPIADLRVRQAINYAIDRDAITKGLFASFATASSAPITRDGWDASLQNAYPNDPAKAKSLLAAAGYPKGFSMRVADFGGLVGTQGDQLIQAVAKYLGQIGIKLQVEPVTTGAQVVSKAYGGDYAVAQTIDGDNPMSFLMNAHFVPKGVVNPFSAKDPALDKLQDKASAAADPAPILKQMTRRIVSQAYFAPVILYPTLWYVTDKIGGVDWSGPGFAPFATAWFPK